MKRSVRGWKRCAWLAIAFVVAVSAAAHAGALPERTDRLIGLARVWAKVKFFHPYLVYKDIDWDAALVAAIPRVEAATSLEEYRTAVQGMLAVLGDPVTRVDPAAPEAPPPGGAAPAWLTTPAPGVLLVRMSGLVAERTDYLTIRARAAQVVAEAARAKVLVIDLRVPRAQAQDVVGLASLIDPALPAIPEWPLQRILEHRGYVTQDGATSGEYYSTFLTTGARLATPGASPGVGHVVVLADRDSAVPPEALALQAAGRATIVARGAIGEDSVVATTGVELPGGLSAQIRLGELLWGPPAADAIVAGEQDLEVRGLAIAKVAVGAKPRARPRKPVALPPLRLRQDLDYADPPYPSREHRLLAGIRMWAVLDSFFPYRYLIADWESALRDALPRLADAADVEGYRRVLREMGARAGDGHVSVYPATPGAKPRGFPAVFARLVERKLTVVQLLDPAEAGKQHLAVGDVIETIDGKPAQDALAARRVEISGSTDEARDQRTAGNLLGGDDGTPVVLGVRGADGQLRDAALTRTVANVAALRAGATGPHWRVLAGNVGYVDLRALQVPEVAAMFADLRDTRAIVFDMRGYPNGTAWPIAPRINTRGARYGAQFLKPLVSGDTGPDGDERDRRERFLQQLPGLPGSAEIYRGKVVVLIDDRAISQAEHTCLFFAEAAGAVFVGSPTHGANGDVTVMRLPGGLRMSFTGQEVRHVDGRQLQKVGIQPDVLVRPTLAGVRAGKDEVLDRALAYLATGK